MPRDSSRYIISAIVSTYNAERFIRGCLESLENQTIADRLEIIVIDAASQENEYSIVREFQERYDNIRFYRLDRRETVYQAWNRGIRLSRGTYITNANTDDRLRKIALERLVNALEAHPEIPLAYGDCFVTETEDERFERCTPIGAYRMPDFSRNNLLNACIVGPQPVWRRALHEELGFFDEQYQCGADYEFWLRISERYNLLHVQDCLGLYLANKNGVSMKGDQPKKEMLAIQEAYRKRFSTIPTLRSGEIQLFRTVHQLHMERPCVNVLTSQNVSNALLEDFLRLPGLNIRGIDTKESLFLWDIALLDVRDADTALVSDLMSRLRMKYIGLSGLESHDPRGVCPELVEALQRFGCKAISPGWAVYEWTHPMALGMALYRNGSVDDAMAFLGRCLASDPTDVKLLNTLSRIAFENNLIDSSEAFALKAAQLDRRNTESLTNLIKISMAKGREDRARELSEYVLDIDKTKQPVMDKILGPEADQMSSFRTKVQSCSKSPRKILVINNLYPPQELGGYGRNIADFTSLLEQRGHEIFVLTSDTRYLGEPSENEPHVRRELHLCGVWDEKGQRLFDKDRINSFIRMNREAIGRTLKRFHPDICVAGNMDLLGIPVLEPLFEYHVPILHYLGNEFPAYNPPDSPRHRGYHVAAASQWLKQDAIRRGYPFEDAHVIYPGAFVQSFKMAVPPATDTLRIAYAGLVTDSKGPQVLIEALHILARNGIEFRCSIAGGTLNKRFLAGLVRGVQDLGLADKITFTGQLDRNGLKGLFAKSNVLVFPSLANETFGISQVEGMAAGLLLITSGPGGAREIIEEGRSGLSFEPGKSAHLAEQLVRLIKDRGEWERIALAGQRRAMELFDIEQSIDTLESIFPRMLDKRNGLANRPLESTVKNPSVRGTEPEHPCKDEIEEIRPVRMQLAQLWMKIPFTGLQNAYQGNPGKWQRRIACPELKSHPLTREEQEFVDQRVDSLLRNMGDNGAVQDVLAAMLYLAPYQMPITLDIERMPDWFQWDYFRFLIEAPGGMLKSGEAEAYYRHIRAVVQNLAERIRMKPDSKLWASVATSFVQASLLSPLYFIKQPLKDVYVSRGDILWHVFQSAGCNLDYNFPIRPADRKKIRLGVHLANLRSVTEIHATLPIFEFLDREVFEIFLYISESNRGSREKYYRDLADRFVVMPKDIKEWGKTIRADDLDILLLGNNSTAGLNSSTILGTHRLARVQCVHFCSPVTTGLKHMDYFLLGNLIDPEGKAEAEYSEKLLRVPGSGICFSMRPTAKAIDNRFARSDFGIPENCPLFVSGANFHKITPELRTTWAQIIARVQGSVLALYPFGPAWSSSYPERQFTEEMKAVFHRYGIAGDRLVILKPFESRDHIKSFLMLADVYLDATPYSGATSLLDPLEAGPPPVVTGGAELRFCQGAAMLKELGVPDLVTENEEDYVRLAVRLGTDPDFRAVKSMEIREKMVEGPAFLDPRSYAEKVGRVLKSVIEGKLMPV